MESILENVFLTVLNMSLTGSYVIAAILLVRWLLKRAPKKCSFLLWAVVGFRLICPVSFAAVFSLFRPLDLPVQNAALTSVPQDIGYHLQPQVAVGIPAVSQAVSGSLPAATPMVSVNPMQIWIFLGTNLWCLGIVVLLVYAIINYVKLIKQF